MEAQDRVCRILVEDLSLCSDVDAKMIPLGLVVYKSEPSDEFANDGITKSLEIKTLVVSDEHARAGQVFFALFGIHRYLLHGR